MQQLPSLHGGPSPDRAEPRRSSTRSLFTNWHHRVVRPVLQSSWKQVLQLQATWVEVSLW
ncbi:unnamed protein product [Linum tenue]|uniref:Uncharacterized protein n=1 Tax=Linum tenue TaxID=586396 RepID=A0AAV0KLN8_9ROSI|nr:unnamed protein product [Linum tenue]